MTAARLLRLFPALALLLAAALGPGSARPQESATATFTVDARLGGQSVDGVQVRLRCTGIDPDAERAADTAFVEDGGTVVFERPLAADQSISCTIVAEAPAGLRIRYLGDGGSEVAVGEGGCRFDAVAPGHANFCQVRVESRTTSITVYKKWIGATRNEADVAVELVCADGIAREARAINAGRPSGWTLELTDPEGVLCDVREEEREEYVADISDCQGLLVLPGAQEECTMVNTKVVKMIDMLNRYGLFVMIAVFGVAGMIASRRFVN